MLEEWQVVVADKEALVEKLMSQEAIMAARQRDMERCVGGARGDRV